MKTCYVQIALCGILSVLIFTGCVTEPYDYTNFRAHLPRSILILPPLNESTDVAGTYSYLSTVTMPISELGYYVYPVAVVDQFFKENGMPMAGEMHQAPLKKIREIIGADAVLYLTLKQYGTKYQVLNSATVVTAEARLVDTETGTLLWTGVVSAQENSGGSGDIFADLISALIFQAINKSTDNAHDVAHTANAQFAIQNRGLLYGPYHPKYGKE